MSVTFNSGDPYWRFRGWSTNTAGSDCAGRHELPKDSAPISVRTASPRVKR